MATYITKYGKTDNSGLSYIKLFGRLGNLKGLLRTKAPSILVYFNVSTCETECELIVFRRESLMLTL